MLILDFIFLTEEGNQLLENFKKIQTLMGSLAQDYYQNLWFVDDFNDAVDLEESMGYSCVVCLRARCEKRMPVLKTS